MAGAGPGGRGHAGSHPLAGDQGRGSCGRSRRRSGAEDWTPRARCCCPGQSPHRTAAAPHSAWRGSMAGPPINTEAEQPHCGGRRARPATGLRDHGTGQVGEESDGAAGHRRSCTTECVAFIGSRQPVTTPTLNMHYHLNSKIPSNIEYR